MIIRDAITKKNVLKWSVRLVVVFCGVCLVGAGALYYTLSCDLPSIASLKDYRPSVITTVYADDDRKIAEFYKTRRLVLPMENIPEQLVQAFVAAEDARFFQHTGIDLFSVVRAFIKNMQAGEIVQGGSTITQQVAKSFFLSSERTYTRKAKEAFLSYRIEKRFTKQEILFLYLNQIYLGHGAYGVEAAAQNYFRKSAADLKLAECALLAGLPQAPSRYSPFTHPERANVRQEYVLRQMVAREYITEEEAEAASQEALDISPVQNWFRAMTPWYSEYVRRYVEHKYGRDILYNEGLSIYTAVNVNMQEIARREMDTGLRALDKRQGYRGPEQHLDKEAIEPFLDELRQSVALEEIPPPVGSIVRGVVVDVDDAADRVRVRLAFGSGEISLADMKWARKPNAKVAWYKYEGKIQSPSQALAVGDVVLVKINSTTLDASKTVPNDTPTNAPKTSDTPDNQDAEDIAARPLPEINAVCELSLEQTPAVEAALVCMENKTGQVKVMVGGRDAEKSQFNRVIQARRQPGSAFKPIIYAAALDKGYTAASMIVDSAIVFEDEENDFTWKPQNYEEKFFGPTLFRRALIKSHNIPTIKILMDIGVDYVRDYAHNLGIASPLSRDLSIALGSSGLAPIELVQAYSTFANLGERATPIFIKKIIDRDGNILEEHTPQLEQVIDKDTAYIMTHLLRGVVEHGTGRRVRALNRPAAGKTGTTDNLDDAWFVGYTPDYVTAVWVGFDKERSLGASETGASAASPIWLAFMKTILEGQPVRDFEVPEGVVFSKIDADTGLLPIPESENTFFECFKEGTVPTEYTPTPGSVVEEEQFFKKGMF